MTILLAVTLGLATAIQLIVLVAMDRRTPVGDELVYLERGASEEPCAPRTFLRPPLLPWLARLTYLAGDRKGDQPACRLRLVMALVSCGTLGLVAVAGWRLGGAAVATLAVVLLSLQPERLLLACHIWPDTILAGLLAGLLVLQTQPPTATVALGMGLVCTVGALCRIDWLAVLPFLLLAWPNPTDSSPPLVAWTLILAPPLLVLVCLSIWNGRRFGIFLPDTTWAFNLMVADSEARSREGPRFAIEGTVEDVLGTWVAKPGAGSGQGLAAAGRLAGSPFRVLLGLGRRVLTLLGPDTFVRQRLLANGVYPDLSRRWRRFWDASLKIAFPLLATWLLVASVVGGRPVPHYLWPTLGLAAAAVAVHTRTRYRVALLPALCLFAAEQIHRLPMLEIKPKLLALAAVTGLALFTFLVRYRGADELERPTD